MLRFCAFLLFILSFQITHAQTISSARGIQNMEAGERVAADILLFMNQRPCQFGLRADCDVPLSLKEIDLIKSLFRKLDSWNKTTFEEVVPATDLINGLSFDVKIGDRFAVKQTGKKLLITLSANDEESREYIQSIQMASASMLMMYDKLFEISQGLAKAKKLRSILENDIGEESHYLRNFFARGTDEKIWKNVRANLTFLEKAKSLFTPNYFQQYIVNSLTASKIEDKNFIFRMKNVILLRSMLNETRFMAALEQIMFKLSQFFGNTVGQVQSRNGKLFAKAKDLTWMKSLKSKLRPLDILMEKTPFRLTDRFIPGHFGHAALWIGNPEELLRYTVQYQGREIPLLDHPVMFPYLEKLSQGKLVLEALREPGVTLNTLEHFMDIDDFLIVRKDELTNEGEKVLKAIEQFGKPYDFNFDVETQGSIVCSELVYMVYDDVNWPTDKTFGRYTISPDHIAWKAVDNCLKPTLFIHDGEEIKQNLKSELERFLSVKGGIRYTSTGSCH